VPGLHPGPAPLRELAVRVAPLAGTDAATVLPGLADDPARFALTAQAAALAGPHGPAPGAEDERRLLIVIDQCEQLFTRCDSEPERRGFITALHAAATGNGGTQPRAALVVLVIRADFEARLADYPPLEGAVKDRYLLTAMNELQLRMAITQPAAAAGTTVEPDLVQVLLDEVRARNTADHDGPAAAGPSRAGVLPLLSHALDQAWRSRTGTVLALADYERSGGIEGAIAVSAERAYRQLTPAHQVAARQVFTRLTTSTSGADTVARATRGDLIADKDTAQERDVDTVLEAFAAERLLTLAAGTVEISHEALLTAWPLLRDTWLAETRTDRAIRGRLHGTAEEWARASRDPAFLYSGSRLETAADTAARISSGTRHTPLTQTEKDFLRASELASLRRARRRHGLVAIVLALVVGLAAVSVTAVLAEEGAQHASQVAAGERDMALSDAKANQSEANAGSNASTSLRESIVALSIEPSSAQARFAVQAAAANPQIATISTGNGPLSSVTYSPDGTTLATVGGNGIAQLWNATTGAVVFSPDHKLLAVVDIDGNAVRLIDVAAPSHQIRIPYAAYRGQGAGSVVFSPNGKLLTILGNGYANIPVVGVPLQLWDLSTDPPTPFGHRFDFTYGGATDAAFDSSGHTLAVIDSQYSDGTGPVQLWDVAASPPGAMGGSFASTNGGTVQAALSPDGAMLAAVNVGAADGLGGLGNGSVQLWHVTGGHHSPIGGRFASETQGAIFSPNARLLATIGEQTYQDGYGSSTYSSGPVRLWARSSTTLWLAASAGWYPWCSARTAPSSPPAALTVRCGCGMCRPGSRSAALSPTGPEIRSGRWRSAMGARRWRFMARRRSCGTSVISSTRWHRCARKSGVPSAQPSGPSTRDRDRRTGTSAAGETRQAVAGGGVICPWVVCPAAAKGVVAPQPPWPKGVRVPRTPSGGRPRATNPLGAAAYPRAFS
jgi:hypothetical protein